MKTKNENHNTNVTNANPPRRPSGRSPNGKVARLPAIVRQIVNDMLYNGFPYKEIISTVDALGCPGLSHHNISSWKCGFHQHWVRQRENRSAPLPLPSISADSTHQQRMAALKAIDALFGISCAPTRTQSQ